MANTNKFIYQKDIDFDSGVLRYALPAAIIVIGIVFTIIGIIDGEINAVLSKATALCRECVGIG